MRQVREVEEEILSRPGRYRKVAENLKVKEVRHQGKRYIMCLKEEAEREGEARYDGKYVLLTDSDLPADQVALAYKGLWRVEAAFWELKDQLELGPIYHWTKPRVERCAELRSAALLRAHVAVCFLAFLLEVELERRLKELEVGGELPGGGFGP